MSVCYLVGAGDFYGHIDLSDGDVIIAADGGYDNLASHGLIANVLIGDFDSIKSTLPDGIKTIRHPKEKDETDMFLAYSEGVKLGFTDFIMLGATGGRLDHTYANISLLLYAKEHGHSMTIVHDGGAILCIKDEAVTLSGRRGALLSVFALGTEANGVSIKGAKYEADGVTLSPSFPLGVSNEFTDEKAVISVQSGALLIIYDSRL